RRINLLFDRTLLAGFLGDRLVVTEDNVREVAAEMSSETARTSTPDSAVARQPSPAQPSVSAEVLELGRMRPTRRPEGVTIEQDPASVAAIAHLEEELHRLQESMARVERGNQATLTLLKRFMDWIRSQDES